MKAREFLFRAEDRALQLLGDAAPPQRRVMWTVLQYHFGESWLHYELQPQPARGLFEVGLHFEGPAEQSERAAQLVASHAPALLHRLGPGWELEEWTPSWRRLHRAFAFEMLAPDLIEEVAGAFADLVDATAPVLEATGLLNEPRAPSDKPAPGPARRRRRR